MKIGIDCRLWNETGVGRYIRNLVSELSKIDTKNSYVLFALDKDVSSIKYQVLSKNWKIVIANIHWHAIAEQIKFPQILNRENLDIVHFPYQSVPIFYNNPFILTIHDLIPYNFPTGKASALPFFLYWLKFLAYKYVLRNAAKKAKKVIAVSNATKKEIIDHLGVEGNKVVVTYEGVDEKVQSPKSKIKGLIRGKYFLYIGNAYPHKNLERLLEAFSNIRNQFVAIRNDSDVKLVLVGKEDYFYKRLKKKVEEMKLSNKVIFLQNVYDEELSGLYKNALALIAPSLMEGFGLPALEAMANNCLVLASKTPALEEICGDAAIYFNPFSVRDIEKTMREVYFNDSNHFSKRIEKGLERVKLFSWQKTAQETLQVYESCFGV